MHAAFGDHQVANVAAEVEARTIGASVRIPALDPGRHSDLNPYYGMGKFKTYPFSGSGMVVLGQRLTHAADQQHAPASGRRSAQPPAQLGQRTPAEVRVPEARWADRGRPSAPSRATPTATRATGSKGSRPHPRLGSGLESRRTVRGRR